MTEYALRFLIGGCVVSVFAVLGDVLRPKSFAGLFGAAPSVALASLGLAIVHHGAAYAAIEARAMICGALALGVYGYLVCRLLMVAHWHALSATMICLIAWLVIAFALLQVSGLRA
jgi:hypothetical protein